MLKELFGKTQNEKKKNIIRIIYLTVAVILMVSVALAIALAVGSKKNDTTVDNDDNSTDVTERVLKYSLADTKKGVLIVVNRNNSFDFKANESSLTSMSTSQNYTLKTDSMKANKTALSALNKMLGDFYSQATDKDAAKKLTIWSAYRSFEEQKGSLPAGNSDFHTGMLFELTLDGAADPIKKDDVFGWIYEHAHEYGFIQRYPTGKSSKTGVPDFENAFRYVGVPHAKYIKEHNLCLEEYVELIQKATEPITTSDGYKITYVKANTDGQTEITVTSTNYLVSGDNMGGFIVASK